MRTILLALIALLAAPVAAGCRKKDPGFVLHEWGTLTTLAASDGTLLSGIGYDEGTLPSFVYRRDSLQGDQYRTSMKMETPVIYLYSERARKVHLLVQWPEGILSEWYPNVRGMFPPPNRDGGSLRNGLLCWGDIEILAPGEGRKLVPEVQPDEPWAFAREVDANILKTPGPGTQPEHEHYLFYRGLGGSHLRARVRLDKDSIILQNDGTDPVHAPLYLRVKSGRTYAAVGDDVGAGATASQPRNALEEITVEKVMAVLEVRLTRRGLYPKEARAMVRTWRRSYFETDGMRVLYLLPRGTAESMLPMQVTPPPRESVRVLVARLDVLTAEQEDETIRTVEEAKTPEEAHKRLGRFAGTMLRRFAETTDDETLRQKAHALIERTGS